MVRVKRGNTLRKRHKKMLGKAKGFYGRAGAIFKQAKPFVQRSLMYATRDRKARKHDFRSLWIVRLHAALLQRNLGYSEFMGAFTKSTLRLNRKMLSQLAIVDPAAFDAVLAEVVATPKAA